MANRENIFLRKDGRFEARYRKGRDNNGKLIYGFCYGKTYEEAQEKVRRLQGDPSFLRALEETKELKFSHYCNRWLVSNRERLKESSTAKYLADIRNHIIPFFGEKLPSNITSEDMDLFIQQLLYEKNLSSKTARDILALFHSIFVYSGRRSGQTLPELEIIYPKQKKKSVRVLNEGEEQRLIQFLAREMDLCKFGVYLALRTGLRIGEVCALRWSDISLETYSISINRTVQRIQSPGQGNEPRTRIVVGAPKTESSCRTIPLMPDLAALCVRFAPGDPGAFVLTGTGQCMEPRKLQRRLKDYMDQCRIQAVHFHTLRHTFATRCMEAGFDVKTLSEILGHSSISVTLNQYVHPNLEQKRENMSRLKTMLHD